jgi:DNA modification methylase
MARRFHQKGHCSFDLPSEDRQRSTADRASSLKVRLAAVCSLKLCARNPRIHSAKQLRQIARSIETFGFNVPVLIDGNLNVIAGHGRIMAAQLLGWKEVPTICLDHLTESQAKAFMIADNRLTENSTWDDRLLAEQLQELSALDLDFSLEVIGFDMGEIDFRIEEQKAPQTIDKDPADMLPEESSGPQVSRVGDLWLLGTHRVYCGSALEDASYEVLMQGDRAAMVFTDAPYNFSIQRNVSGLGSIRHREFVMASGDMTEAEFTTFLIRACSLLTRNSRNGSLHYLCMDWRHMSELLSAGRQVYSELKNLCIWAKDSPGMGSLYRSQHELIFVFKNGRGAHRNNVQLGQYGRNRGNVWHYAGVNSFARATDEGNLLALHPTVKPVALVLDAILDCTARGDAVLDGFLGSGTTVIAAERTGRCCYGLELDPLYVDTIVRRWQAYTGNVARHASSGKSFSQLEAETEEHHAR